MCCVEVYILIMCVCVGGGVYIVPGVVFFMNRNTVFSTFSVH